MLQTPQLAELELNMLVARECREWDVRLERLIGEIQGPMAFLGRPGRLVVLDTSALMEACSSLASTGTSSTCRWKGTQCASSCHRW